MLKALFSLWIALFWWISSIAVARAQTIYVDQVKGHQHAAGTPEDPLNTLENAVAFANTFSGKKQVTIKLAPGLYVLDKQIVINPFNQAPDTAKYTIEAQIMPDDTAWRPKMMPVIQSVSANNRDYGHFNHCIAFQIERNNVCLRGLKFVGNANTSVDYFYAIERLKPELSGLRVSQCYFIGDKNAAPLQGGILAHGVNINIDHCIFYGCKNAILIFFGLKGFSLTHTIIYGAYEGALWYGWKETADMPFTFHDNIIARCNYFFVGYPGIHLSYVFRNSLITNNRHYMGFNKDKIEPDMENKPKEEHIIKTGKVILNEVTLDGIRRNYLHPSTTSAGRNIDAGIF